MPITLPSELLAARDLIESRLKSNGAASRPLIGVIAGSGLGGFVESVKVKETIPYSEIPGLAQGHVPGHASKWVIGEAEGVPIHVLAGRRHFYEGIGPAQAIHAVRTLALSGVRLVVISNAAGGLSPKLWPGDLMLIRDHINLQFRNPLIGRNEDELGPRFPDMSDPYHPAAGAMLRRAAMAEGIGLKEGVYLALAGPAYETPAEVEFLRRIGADAVGMSTVPEVIAARHAGMAVLGISLITNSHVNRKVDEPVSHEEVLTVGREGQEKFSRLLRSSLPRLAALAESPSFEGEREE